MRWLSNAPTLFATSVAAALLFVFVPLAVAAPAPDSVDPAVVRLLQREIELLKASLEKATKELESLESRVKKSPEAARVAALEKKLTELEAERTAAAEATPEPAAETVPSDAFDVDGHLFVRPEYVNNTQDFDSSIGDEDFFVRQRMRLGASFAPLDWLEVRADLQNSTVWGANLSEARTFQNYLGFHQAYVRVGVPAVPGLEVKAGRMALEYGSGRLIGADDFNFRPRYFDGAVVSYEHPKDWIRADLFGSVVEERSTPIGRDRNFYGLYLSTGALKNHEFDLYVLYLEDGLPENEQDIVSIGVRAAGEPLKGLKFDAEATVQVGKVDSPRVTSDGAVEGYRSVDHIAAAYFVSLDYTVPAWGAPTFGVFFSSGSGDGNPGDDRHVDFSPLFPSQHEFWGRLDLFAMTNLIDAGGRVRFTPWNQLDLLFEVHRFFAVEALGHVPGGREGQEPTDSGLGTELDVVLAWRPNRHFSLEGGYSVFLPDDSATVPVLKGSDRADWAYVQLRVDL